MSKLSRWLGKNVRFDKHTLGNVVKNVSPALAFTPLGALGAGAASVGGDLLRGKRDAGQIAKGALTNAAIGSGAKAGYGALKGSFGGGGGAGADLAAPNNGFTNTWTPQVDGSELDAAPGVFSRIGSGAGRLASSAGNVANKVGSFVEKNPNATALGLNAVASVASGNDERRMQDYEMSRQTRMDDEERERQRRRDMAADQIRQIISQQYGALR